MAVVTSETLQNLQAGQSVSGVVLIKANSIQLTKNGKEYVQGTLQSGVEVPFKAWNNSKAFGKLKAEDYTNIPTHITATVDGFGGTNSLIIDDVMAVEGFTADQFLPIKYNIEAYWNALVSQIQQKCSEKAFAIADKVLFSNTEVAERFKLEFAAMSHHDNCKGGLLTHTYKTLQNTHNIINQYPALVSKEGVVDKNMTDLLYLGALLHDIGKTVEMQFGSYQPQSVVNHSYLGMEFIAKYKSEIVEAYDEQWYYNLVTILLQHHGEFGEPCKSVAAYIIHRADEFDSSLTLLAQSMEMAVDGSSGKRVKMDGKWLTLY